MDSRSATGAGDDLTAPLIEAVGVSKCFPGVQALDDVSLRVSKGEVLAVVGENGAGKSTLMRVLGGIVLPDAGEIRLDGEPVVIDSVQAAAAKGISLIHQELNLADNLDVASNVFLGREPRRGGILGLVARDSLHANTTEILGKLKVGVSSTALVRSLDIGQQQMVEIAKALSVQARLLIMDEPTSSLSQGETETLFEVIRGLKAQGVSVIFVSHRLGEVGEIADRVEVLKDGRNSGSLDRSKIKRERMVRLMVGRDIEEFYQRTEEPGDRIALEVLEVTTMRYPSSTVSINVKAGEVVTLCGLVGAGRTELLHALFGIDPLLGGSVRIDGKEVEIASPGDAIEKGLGLVPEDRRLNGLIVDMAIEANVTLPGLSEYQRFSIMDRHKTVSVARQMVDDLDIRTPSIEQIVALLSGGNQQKVVLAKWLSLGPRILLLDEPTRGVDVGAKEEIYRIMDRLSADGVAMLVVSSDLQEAIGVSDRIVVMHEGKITGELYRESFSEEIIMRYATGGI